MATIIKKTLLTLILPTTLTTLSMEKNYPQLQLQIKEALPTIYAELSIKATNKSFSTIRDCAHLATERERKNIHETMGVLSSINTPFIPVTVSVRQSSNNTTHPWSNWPLPIENKNKSIARFPSSIPAELLWNLSKGSILNLTVHGYPVKLQCCNNTTIDNKEFHQQFNMYMEHFYHRPYTAKGYCQENKLISAGVLTLAITNEDEIANNENAMPFYSYEWGPNGCPNEQVFVQSIINEKIPTNKNVFKSIMHQQINDKY